MSTMIGTVGFFNQSTGRGVIHPDAEFASAGLNILLTPEGSGPSDIEMLSSGARVTFVVANGQEGPQALELKSYHGTGVPR